MSQKGFALSLIWSLLLLLFCRGGGSRWVGGRAVGKQPPTSLLPVFVPKF